MTQQRYTITTALPYANGPLHLGHVAGVYLPADIFVRFLRMNHHDVAFICGSDEHGAAITLRAKKEGITPQEIVDKYNAIIHSAFTDFDISFDIFHRTSSEIHHKTSQEFFLKMYENGSFTQETSEQYYDQEYNQFLADRYIKGTCPNCGHHEAYGDQCEKCGKSLSPEELINPVSTLSGNAPIKKETTHWYLPLNKHEDFLREWILKEHVSDWRPAVVGQCKSWIDGGLQPRAVTRDLDWGVKVPVAGGDGKVLYVWFDAPIGYISATKQWAKDNGKDWTPYWNDSETKLVHFIGKDNIVFHCIIFPIMLKLHGHILPESVPANEFMNLEGDKMSTSKGWSIEMDDYINKWIKKENGGTGLADSLRFYLTSIAPESKDSEFTWKGFQESVNGELVSIFANYVNRTWVLMHKLCKGKVPPIHPDLLDEEDNAILQSVKDSKAKITELLEQYKFRDAQFEVINLARIGNQYMQKKEPWILAKNIATDPTAQAKIDNCMHACLQLCANLAILINPFLPFTAKKMCHLMKVVDKMLDWENAGNFNLLKVGYSLRPPELLFRKIEDEEIEAELVQLQNNLKAKKITMDTITTTDASAAPEANDNAFKPEIVFDDFGKIDLRVGTIIDAKKVEKADKLLQLEVDLGLEKRTILSGIAMHFDPADIIGKQVVVVANLAPRKMRGVESKGMILMAEDAHGKLYFVQPSEAIAAGSKIS